LWIRLGKFTQALFAKGFPGLCKKKRHLEILIEINEMENHLLATRGFESKFSPKRDKDVRSLSKM
jgi:hypothetical protein